MLARLSVVATTVSGLSGEFGPAGLVCGPAGVAGRSGSLLGGCGIGATAPAGTTLPGSADPPAATTTPGSRDSVSVGAASGGEVGLTATAGPALRPGMARGPALAFGAIGIAGR